MVAMSCFADLPLPKRNSFLRPFLQSEGGLRKGSNQRTLRSRPSLTPVSLLVLQKKPLALGPQWPTDHPLAASSPDRE